MKGLSSRAQQLCGSHRTAELVAPSHLPYPLRHRLRLCWHCLGGCNLSKQLSTTVGGASLQDRLALGYGAPIPTKPTDQSLHCRLMRRGLSFRFRDCRVQIPDEIQPSCPGNLNSIVKSHIQTCKLSQSVICAGGRG